MLQKRSLTRYRAQTFRGVSLLVHENFIKICMNQIHLRAPRIICLCQAVLRQTFGDICMSPAQTFPFERQPVRRSDILSTVDNSFHLPFRSLSLALILVSFPRASSNCGNNRARKNKRKPCVKWVFVFLTSCISRNKRAISLLNLSCVHI